jgi:hypothetical protein
MFVPHEAHFVNETFSNIVLLRWMADLLIDSAEIQQSSHRHRIHDWVRADASANAESEGIRAAPGDHVPSWAL